MFNNKNFTDNISFFTQVRLVSQREYETICFDFDQCIVMPGITKRSELCVSTKWNLVQNETCITVKGRGIILISEISIFRWNVKVTALNFSWNACRNVMMTTATENVIAMITFVSTVSKILLSPAKINLFRLSLSHRLHIWLWRMWKPHL